MMRYTIPGARVEARRTGTILGLFGTGDDQGGELMDISGLGLRYISKSKQNLEANLKLSVSFPGAKERLECAGIVRWSHAHSRPGAFVIGIEFAQLNETQMKLLDKMQKGAPKTP